MSILLEPDEEPAEYPAVRSTNGRWIGAAIIAVVVFLAMLVPRLVGVGTAGEPVPTVLPPMPGVGDCVRSVTNPWQHVTRTDDGRNLYDFPWAVFEPCGARRKGEVVAVLPGTDTPDRTEAAGAPLNLCDAATEVGTGMSVGTRSGRTYFEWVPLVRVEVVTVGPDPTQRAAGRRYVLCVAMIPADDGSGPQSYDGTLRSTRPPDATGRCLPAVTDLTDRSEYDLLRRAVPCDGPHAVQIIAQARMTAGRSTSADRDAACQAAAPALVGRPDPTDGGRLRYVSLMPEFPWCAAAVVGNGQLIGSLIDLGQAPFPWVS